MLHTVETEIINYEGINKNLKGSGCDLFYRHSYNTSIFLGRHKKNAKINPKCEAEKLTDTHQLL